MFTQPSASWSASGRTQGWLCVGCLCFCVRCLSPRQQHYPAWSVARRPRLSLEFPYHNPYERIIVVVGSVLVFASLLACVWRGWFSRVSCCRPLCVRAIHVQARRSYDMMILVLEVLLSVQALRSFTLWICLQFGLLQLL